MNTTITFFCNIINSPSIYNLQCFSLALSYHTACILFTSWLSSLKLSLLLSISNVWFRKISMPPPTTKSQWNFWGVAGIEEWSFWGVWVHRKLLFHARGEEASKRQRTIDRKHKVILTYIVLLKKATFHWNEVNMTSSIASVFHLSLLALLSLGLFQRHLVWLSQIKRADMTG